MILPVLGDVPEGIITLVVGGVASAGAGLAGWLVRQRAADRKDLLDAAGVVREELLSAQKTAREEQDKWRDEIRKDRDTAYTRMDKLEAELAETRRLLAETRAALDAALTTLALRTRQIDAYENELSVVRGQNAVMRIEIATLQAQMSGTLQAHIAATVRRRGGRRGTDG